MTELVGQTAHPRLAALGWPAAVAGLLVLACLAGALITVAPPFVLLLGLSAREGADRTRNLRRDPCGWRGARHRGGPTG